MFTDMVGYSALTQKDEALSMVLLREHRNMMRPLFGAHSGKEIKTTGDGFLVEFSSALDAVLCAISMQETLVNHNKSALPDRRIQIRIGIHLGEIEEYENDVYGDGVNVAARIEPLAEPNGICISDVIAHQVNKKIDYPIVSMGEPVLKNIKATIEVFRIVVPWLADSIHFVPQKFQQKSTTHKSIAVLPFMNMSSDQENEYFSDGLTEELINVLTRVKNLKVTSRTSAFVFKGKTVPLQQIGKQLNVGIVLEGSVRKAGHKVRITGQLIRVADDTHLWSETFDRDLDDVFAVQDEIAQSIVKTLDVHLSDEIEVLRVKRPTDNMEAYTLFLQGRYHFNKMTPDDILKSIEFYEEAISNDPKYALAFAGLGLAYFRLAELSPNNARYDKAEKAARQANDLDAGLAEAHVVLGLVTRSYYKNFVLAEKEFKIALALHPIDVMAYNSYGSLLLTMKKNDEALAMHSIANEMDPLHVPTLFWLGRAYLYNRDYDKTIELCEKIISMAPDFPFVNFQMTCAYFLKGEYEATFAMLEKTNAASTDHSHIALLVDMARHRMGNSESLKQSLSNYLGSQKDVSGKTGASSGANDIFKAAWIAVIYAEFGDEDRTLEWLKTADEENDPMLFEIRAWPQDMPFFQYPKVVAFLDELAEPAM
jgi:TolB-like protein/Tfp pilus assembly protein PilF